MFKRKSENEDVLHLSKIPKLEVESDALKSHITFEISILANKLDSLSIVLQETLKFLEQRDIRNSKLLLENFKFPRKEILSKDEFSKYLMETQTTVVDVVTSTFTTVVCVST